jgi:fucose 4-O-acetylase-like acetyltransferase
LQAANLSSAGANSTRGTAQKPQGRDQALDVAKGFGIVLVVLGHCLDGLVAGNYFPSNVLWPTLAIYAIYAFHMPLFFVVSGLLASGKHRPAGTTITRLLPTIVWPYVLWSVVQWGVMWYLSRYTTSKVTVAQLLRIPWVPIVPYWFLYALFFCHVLYLIMRKRGPLTQMVVATALFLGPQFWDVFLAKHEMGVILQIVRGFFFFTLGVVTATQIKQLGRWAAIVATMLFAALAVVHYQAQLTGPMAGILLTPVAVAGIVATLGWSRDLAEAHGALVERLTGMLAFFGRYSMSIYVMHIFFTAGVRIALRKYAMHPTALVTAVEIVSATVIGTLAPLAINWVASKIHADTWLGLQHMERA